MKVLLTGGTGFLGKFVLTRLLAGSQDVQITVLSRAGRTYPNPRVKVIKCDLNSFQCLDEIPCDFDHVVHLAACYDLRKKYAENYLSNVAATFNLVEWLKKQNYRHSISYASTYAVTAADSAHAKTGEQPIDMMPPTHLSYAHTKALAEKFLLSSGLPTKIYRFGTLIGAKNNGYIEKFDGPYLVLKQLARLKRQFGGPALSFIPIIGKKDAVVPLVPVDEAAAVLIQGISDLSIPSSGIFGVYNPASLQIENLISEFLEYLGAKRHRVSRALDTLCGRSASLQYLNAAFFPTEFTELAETKYPLLNPAFAEFFPKNKISHFLAYRRDFFRGFEELLADGSEKKRVSP